MVKSVPKIIIPQDRENFEYLVNRCDQYAQRHYGRISAVILRLSAENVGLIRWTPTLLLRRKAAGDKTACFAATPSLTSYGILGRENLFEVKQWVK